MRECGWCWEPMDGRRPNAQYCDKICKAAAYRDRKRLARPARPDPGLPEREREVLRVAAGGPSLSEVARITGLPRTRVAKLLSECYARLGVKDVPCHHLSQDRRQAAVKVARERGWL